jgi:Protein of Unknown function (DUF2784)
MSYRLLATLILTLHFGYLAYLVAGGFVAWRWPRTIWLHLAATGWGLALVAADLACPLTAAEDWARRRAGQAGLTRGFIDRYIEGVVYPQRDTTIARVLVAIVVLVSWAGLVARRRRGGAGAGRARPLSRPAARERAPRRAG